MVPTTRSVLMHQNRLLLGLALASSLSVVGLLAGTVIGSLLLVPADSGPAGAAIALRYGVGGAVLAVVGAILAAWRLPPRALRRTMSVALVLALAVFGWVAYRVWGSRANAPGRTTSTPRSPAERAFRVRIEVTDEGAHDAGPDIQELILERSATRSEVVWTTREISGPQRCRGDLLGMEAVELAAALQPFSIRVAGGIRGCTYDRADLPVWYRIDWRAARTLTPADEGAVDVDSACLGQLDSARELLLESLAVLERARGDAVCEPAGGGYAAIRSPASAVPVLAR